MKLSDLKPRLVHGYMNRQDEPEIPRIRYSQLTPRQYLAYRKKHAENDRKRLSKYRVEAVK